MSKGGIRVNNLLVDSALESRSRSSFVFTISTYMVVKIYPAIQGERSESHPMSYLLNEKFV